MNLASPPPGKKLGGSTISRTRRDEIIAQLLTGKSIREVAKAVKCSPNTVVKYRDEYAKENTLKK